MSYKIKVRELKAASLNSPRFTLSLQNAGTGQKQISSNYEVLTKLIGEKDFLLSFDTSLMNLPHQKRRDHLKEFLQTVRTLGLEYRCNKVPPGPSQNLIAGLLSRKDVQEEEILVYVPNETWAGDDFKKALPLYGLRYFVARQSTDAAALLDDMQKMLGDEKLDYFKLILFSSVYMNSVGIFTSSMDLAEIKNLLGIL